MTIQRCPTCESLVLRVRNDTRYYSAPRTAPIPLVELRRAFHASTHDETMIIGVFFDPETMTVNRLVLYPSW
jgi:hypothetical protein